jgi:hypothetical protein
MVRDPGVVRVLAGRDCLREAAEVVVEERLLAGCGDLPGKTRIRDGHAAVRARLARAHVKRSRVR